MRRKPCPSPAFSSISIILTLCAALSAPHAGTASAQASQSPFPGSPSSLPGIVQAEDFDEGGEGISYSDVDSVNAGRQYRDTRVDIGTCREGGYEVGWVYAGEWLEYTVNVAVSGVYVVEARVASEGAGGSFHIEFDGQNITGPISVPDTGAWDQFRTVARAGVRLNAGRQIMRVSMDSNGPTRAVGNFNYFAITRGDSGPVDPPPDPSVFGQWAAPFDWPAVAINMSLLPSGKILFWALEKDSNDRDVVNRTAAQLYDPSTGDFTPVPNFNTTLFCSGHSLLPDGRLLVTGGHKGVDFAGEPHTNIFDFRTNTWARAEDMNDGRWYPSNTMLANGEALVVSGAITVGRGINTLPQVWQTSGGWRPLSGAAGRTLPLYPWMFLAPNGMVFNAGPDSTTAFLNTSGAGSWADGPSSRHGYRDYGTAAMYDEGKIIIIGGGEPTNTAEVIDLNSDSPSWRFVSPMAFARRQVNSTILPDGKVLVTGGTSGGGFNNARGAVLAAEMWDPATERFSVMASASVPRLYHSTALLLPDGRVLSAGGGVPAAPEGDSDHLDAQIYSPPYLFRGARPQITSAPPGVGYGERFTIRTPDRRDIGSVVMVRLSSVTHAINMEQRIVRLTFSNVKAGLRTVAPSSRSLCPPGFYMLFILSREGVPSVAKMIQID
ncbi:MAG TPA: galactose oxidase-like domain-containing protein [Blastocatellia bacterium]|nr:galactose oxidase-like domain-containing protein [Blastocatellia bacterium]